MSYMNVRKIGLYFQKKIPCFEKRNKSHFLDQGIFPCKEAEILPSILLRNFYFHFIYQRVNLFFITKLHEC